MGTLFGRMAAPVVGQGKPRVVVIAGTTAVGKTELSLELCRRLNGEVISADSVQVYRHMNIGSAKLDVSTTPIPHHLLSMVDVSQPFNALEFYHMATAAIDDILSRDRVPLVVGGTGFYVRTLLQGPSGAPSSSPASRERVEELLREDQNHWDTSLQRLAAIDPTYAATIERNDWYRLKRGLDICIQSGRTVTSFKTDVNEDAQRYKFQGVFLSMPRSKLFPRIDSRCELMVEQGLFPEVISLVRDHSLVPDSQAGRSLGYRQALEWLQDTWGFPGDEKNRSYPLKIPRDDVQKSFLEFLFNYKAKTRSLARRQLNWYSKQPQFQWLNMAPMEGGGGGGGGGGGVAGGGGGGVGTRGGAGEREVAKRQGGDKLEMAVVGEKVADWLLHDTPLPPHWDGDLLKALSKEEVEYLRCYTTTHGQPEIFSDPAKIDYVVHQIESSLHQPIYTHQ